jgi:hypothetical protein
MVKVVKRKKKEKRGQPPLSDFGNPPLEEKQQRKRTRPALGPYPLRLSSYLIGTLRLLNPNQGIDDGLSGCHAITADECKRYREQLLRTDVSKINSLRLLLLYICLCLQLYHSFVVIGL